MGRQIFTGPFRMRAPFDGLFERPLDADAGGGFLAFILIGGGAALLFVGVSNGVIGLRTGLADWLVSALCYGACVLPVYLLHRRFSFGSHAPHGVALPRYVAVQGAALGLAAVFSYVAYGVAGLPSLSAALLVVGLTSGVNFLVLRRWAFAG